MEIPLTIQQKPQCMRVLNYLRGCGKKANNKVIAMGAGVLDSRSAIRFLRNAGINVLDEWVSIDGNRFKVYWLDKSYTL